MYEKRKNRANDNKAKDRRNRQNNVMAVQRDSTGYSNQVPVLAENDICFRFIPLQ